MADALSRRGEEIDKQMAVQGVTVVEPSWISSVSESYNGDLKARVVGSIHQPL